MENHLNKDVIVIKKYLLPLVALFISTSIMAGTKPLVVVSPTTCAKLKNQTQPFILVLDKGTPINKAITQCAKDAELKGASITGLGAIENPRLAYYSLKKKQFLTHELMGVYELLSLDGNISLVNDKPFAHLHAVVSDSNYNVNGGHLMSGDVGVTLEVSITPLSNKVVRSFNKDIGLNLINAKESNE